MAINDYKQGRINEEVRRELSLLLRDVKDPRVPEMASVVGARVSSDLKYAKVFVSYLGDAPEKDVLRGLKMASGFLRKKLGEHLNMRAVPELMFEIDHSAKTGARIDMLLKKINKEEQE